MDLLSIANKSIVPVYKTSAGAAYCGDSLELIPCLRDESVNLVVTSPPFALQRKKEYDNKDQDEYVDWLLEFVSLVKPKLAKDGSLVLDLGGAYKKGTPSRSLYNFKVLIRICEELGYHLAEDFYWFNPSKLPGPIEWVNKRKIRVKDSVNTVWWLGKSEWPKSNVSQVLTEYSDRMKKLLESPETFYQAKRRPSGHNVSYGFGKRNAGAIPSNLLEIANSESNGAYLSGCKALDIKPHPARFPAKLPEFFVRMLTEPGDLVLDIFAGSNTSGAVAESLDRRWIAFEERREYLASSVFRFSSQGFNHKAAESLYTSVMSGVPVEISTNAQDERQNPKSEEKAEGSLF